MSKFITIEGCEGVGKSTQITLLKEHFANTSKQILFTREPGGSRVSEKIRGIILDKENAALSYECEALLYAAARAQLLREVIIPARAAGKSVICDRFIHSSFAYQGYARGLTFPFIEKINAFALSNMPDLTIFLDLPPESAFKRKGGIDQHDRLELSGSEFHQKVYEGYKKVLKTYPRIVSIDASGSVAQTHKKILERIECLL